MMNVRWLRCLGGVAVPCLALSSGCSSKDTAKDGSGGNTGDTTVAVSGAFAAACGKADPLPSKAPLRRLTPDEYQKTVEELFPESFLPNISLPSDARIGGFTNLAEGQAVSALLTETYKATAEQVADAVSKNLEWIPCDQWGDSENCLAEVARDLATRAYRRTLDDAELGRLQTLVSDSLADYGVVEAVRLLVEGLLQSPWFLYRPEFGDPTLEAPSGLVALSGEEIATRLSYLLRGSAPDAELTMAAHDGELATADGIEAQARRLLSEDDTMQQMVRFQSEWFQLDRLQRVSPDTALFPGFNASVIRSLEDSLHQFFQYAFEQNDSLGTLLTSRKAFVNNVTAPFFGLNSNDFSSDLKMANLDPTERAGVLTHPGLLASTSHARSHAPILRGVFVLDSMLCVKPPPPPANINVAAATEDPGTAVTTREHIEKTHVVAACAACHQAIDGVGFSFENYDAVGRYVTEENGAPVDPTGVLPAGTDVEGEVHGGVELAEMLATSGQVKDCVAAHLYRYTLGRQESSDSDRCQIHRVGETLAQSGGNFEEMLIALLRSDSFRYRPVDQ